MQMRRFGATPLTVSRLGLGLAALGRPGYINLGHADDLRHDYAPTAMERHAHVVLDRAWAAGVRYFDAARSYGSGEAFLASWLTARGIAPEAVVVGSKWGYTYTAGWQVQAEKHEVKEHTLPVLRRQLAESRALLGGHLDLYQIHSATLDSGVLDNHDVLQELGNLRDSGVLVGLSVTGPRQAETIRKALAVQVGSRQLFVCVQATWNLLEPSAGPALEEASRAGLGVLIKEALANGRLTERNQDPDFTEPRRVLGEMARRQGVGLDALALAAVLNRPWVDVVLSGAATVAQLDANLRAFAVAWDEEAARRSAELAEPAEEYWNRRAGLAWN
jgi:aryl-alcohol dehydrogenase-like predicted oxidoreductase